MAHETELVDIVAEMRQIATRFVRSNNGMYLRTEDQARFKGIAVEAKAILDGELGKGNDFSVNIVHSLNSSSGFFGGPSSAAASETMQLIEAAVKQMSRVGSQSPKASKSHLPQYVELTRLDEIRAISNSQWSVIRLIRLCEELNIASEQQCYMAVAMLVRSITDHVPPIFGAKTFRDVANNHGGGKSFRASMDHLENSLRSIADAHLHSHIRASEVLPTATQVDFRADLDVLLGEIVRLAK